MYHKDSSRSFIATVTTEVEGQRGWWNCRDIAQEDTRFKYTAVPWLTVLDTPLAHPARYRFDYYRDPVTGKWGYDILAWDYLHGRSFASLGVRFGMSHNNYVGLYPPSREVDTLWKLFDAQGRGEDRIVETGTQEGLTLRSPNRRKLCACNRTKVGDHWFSYVADEGGPLMVLTLEVVLVGEELLDDN
jgi:hypothetical protein